MSVKNREYKGRQFRVIRKVDYAGSFYYVIYLPSFWNGLFKIFGSEHWELFGEMTSHVYSCDNYVKPTVSESTIDSAIQKFHNIVDRGIEHERVEGLKKQFGDTIV